VGLRNFTVGQHLQAWRHAAHQARDGATDLVGHQQAGRYTDLFLLAAPSRRPLRVNMSATPGSSAGPGTIAQRLHQQALERRVDGDHIEFARRAVDLLHDGRRQGDPDFLASSAGS
jgi:hypothetical protein